MSNERKISPTGTEELILKLSALLQEDLDDLRIFKRKKSTHPVYAMFITYD